MKLFRSHVLAATAFGWVCLSLPAQQAHATAPADQAGSPDAQAPELPASPQEPSVSPGGVTAAYWFGELAPKAV